MCDTCTVEMAICYSNMTWNAGFFVEIPANTPEDKLEEAGCEAIKADADWYLPTGTDIVKIWMYNSYKNVIAKNSLDNPR